MTWYYGSRVASAAAAVDSAGKHSPDGPTVMLTRFACGVLVTEAPSEFDVSFCQQLHLRMHEIQTCLKPILVCQAIGLLQDSASKVRSK